MTAARYWRLIGLQTYDGGDLELCALHLHTSFCRVDESGSIFSSMPPIGGTLANLQDDDTSTLCRFSADTLRAPGFFISWDLGTPQDIKLARPGAASDIGTFLSSATLQFSSDNMTWSGAISLGRYVYPGANTMLSLTGAGTGDIYWDGVGLLLPFDEAVGADSFIESALQNSNFKNPLPAWQVVMPVCKDPHKRRWLPVLPA